MTFISGTLTVQQQPASTEATKIAYLTSALGRFRVHHADIQQLVVGEYGGIFELATFKTGCCLQDDGAFRVEIELQLKQMAFTCEKSAHKQDSQMERTSLEKTVTNKSEDENVPKNASFLPAEVQDADLFGELWPLGETVQLDASVGRDRYRAQSIRLGELGYRLSKDQQWVKALIE